MNVSTYEFKKFERIVKFRSLFMVTARINTGRLNVDVQKVFPHILH